MLRTIVGGGESLKPMVLRILRTSPIEKGPETQVEEIGEPMKTEETATPPEEDEFDWASLPKKKKKRQATSVTQTPPFRIFLIPIARTMVLVEEGV